MSQNPHVRLVHGAWVGGWEFAPVVPALQALDWTVETLELPCTGSTVPPAFQQALAERAGSESIRLTTGNAPFQEDPQGFVDALSRVAASALV